MRNIGLILSYDGSDYFGFQRQNGFITIQEELENAIEKVTKEYSVIYGCGRTDAKVHAKKYLCSFKTNCRIPADKIPVALNTRLPDDIVVYEAFDAPPEFNGRFSVTEKTYRYVISVSEFPDPFLRNYVWHFTYKNIDVGKMKEAAEFIKGKHDFVCFMASGGQVKTTVRTVKDLKIEKKDNFIYIDITADGFLYNMVRIITGTLCYAGIGKLSPADVKNIIESKDRTGAGITAPPEGLYLLDVKYGDINEK